MAVSPDRVAEQQGRKLPNPFAQVLRFLHRTKDTQPPAKAEITSATVERDLKEIQRGLISYVYGDPITPALAEELKQALPSTRKILGEGDLTVVPIPNIGIIRTLKRFSVRRALPEGTAFSGTDPSVLVNLTTTLQINSIEGSVPDKTNILISGPVGRNPDADIRLLHTLASAVLTSRKAVS